MSVTFLRYVDLFITYGASVVLLVQIQATVCCGICAKKDNILRKLTSTEQIVSNGTQYLGYSYTMLLFLAHSRRRLEVSYCDPSLSVFRTSVVFKLFLQMTPFPEPLVQI